MAETTATILGKMTSAEMAEVYNQIPGVLPVTRLGDPTTARRRVELALERAQRRLARHPRTGEVLVVEPGILPGNAMRTIRLLVRKNPKRGASAARYALYRDGMYVGEYIRLAMATGVNRRKARKDLYSDRDRGYIRIED